MKMNFSTEKCIVSLANQIHNTIASNFSGNAILEMGAELTCETQSHLKNLCLSVFVFFFFY